MLLFNPYLLMVDQFSTSQMDINKFALIYIHIYMHLCKHMFVHLTCMDAYMLQKCVNRTFSLRIHVRDKYSNYMANDSNYED